MTQGLWNVLMVAPVFLFSLCIHEWAHAWAAVRLGDNTAKLAGRLSIHPMAHADFFGTFLLPILCIYNGWPFIGWAKPVPVDSSQFRFPRAGMAIVAAAGPFSNLLLSVLFTGVLWGLLQFPATTPEFQRYFQIGLMGVQINLLLAVFNLLPVPPLDGFSVLQGLVPRSLAHSLDGLFRFSGLLIIAVLLFGGFGLLSLPVNYLRNILLGAIGLT